MRRIPVALLVCTWPALAVAQPAPSPSSTASAEADALFDQGRRLMAAGNFAEACSAFDASQKLSPAVTTLMNQAHCRQQNKQLATALGLFREVERQTRTADEAMQQMRQVAIARAAELEPRVSTLTIAVAPANRIEGLVIVRAGVAIDPGAWNQPLPIDGGTYAIVARAPGRVEWTNSVTIDVERDAKTVEVPSLEPVPSPPPDPAQPDVATATKPSKVLPLALGGGGLALLGGALVLDLVARSQYRESEMEPDRQRQESLWEGAKTKRYIAQGVAVAGVACVGVAVWLYLRDRRASAANDAVAVQPSVGADHLSVQLVGRY